MVALEKRMISIYVNRACPERWIVRDADGNFWMVPPTLNPWDHREPFHPTEEMELESVPGHYRYVLGIPG
jgi:hypothetical protein